MPTRSFCDLCDKLLKDDDPTYSATFEPEEVVYRGNWSSSSLHIGDEWVDMNKKFSMVCQPCITAVMAIVMQLQGKFRDKPK